jgi:hypothetical protein
MSRPLNLKHTISLADVVRAWAETAGYPETPDDRPALTEAYLVSLQQMAELLLQHHKEMDDATFARVFRFLNDLPVELEGMEDHPVIQAAIDRFRKFKYTEPGAVAG